MTSIADEIRRRQAPATDAVAELRLARAAALAGVVRLLVAGQLDEAPADGRPPA